MTDDTTPAVTGIIDVDLDDGTTIMVATHGPHRVRGDLCIIVCAGDDDEMICVTVSAAGALVEWVTPGMHTDQCEKAIAALHGGPCVPCAVHAAVGRAVAALLPSGLTPQQLALIAALDGLTRHMPGHEHTEETS